MENTKELIQKTIFAIKEIKIPRYFSSERGFVAEFYCQLRKQLENSNLFPEHTILETEVQKRLKSHGITKRPDLIIHIPIETGLSDNPKENNFVVYAFKLNKKDKDVDDDLKKIYEMFSILNYELGIFINIGAYPNSYLKLYTHKYENKIHEFSIVLERERVRIKYSHFKNGRIISKDI